MNTDYRPDKLDCALIGLLQQNVRARYQEMADATGTSASTVMRRLTRLIESGALKLIAAPDWSRLGVGNSVLLNVSVDARRLPEVGHELVTLPETCWVALTTGSHPLVALALLPQITDIVAFISERIAPIPGVRDVQTVVVLELLKSFDEHRPLAASAGQDTVPESLLQRARSGIAAD